MEGTCSNRFKVMIVVTQRRYTRLIGGSLKREQELYFGLSKLSHLGIHLSMLRFRLDFLGVPLDHSVLFPVRVLLNFFSFLRQIKINCPHLVISLSPIPTAILLFIRGLIGNSVKIVFLDRGDPILSVISPIRTTYSKVLMLIKIVLTMLIEKISVAYSDVVIFNSRWRIRQIRSRYSLPTKKFALVYNNANVAWLPSPHEVNIAEDVMLIKSAGKKIVGFIGRINEYGNGIDVLLYAFKLLKTKFENVHLFIIGDGKDLNRVRNKVRYLKLEDSVSLVGYISDVSRYLKGFDILVQPARYQCCPNVVLEAFRFNIPVIVSNVGGMPELVNDSDLIFESENFSSLANKMFKLLTDKQLYSKKCAWVRFLYKKFSFPWPKIIISTILSLLLHDV